MTKIVGCYLLFSALQPLARAQERPAGPDGMVDAATRTQVIDGALELLETAYVFPETAAKMAEAIRARAERKEYDLITSARGLADLLTTHLQEVSRDKHLRVRYSDEPVPARRTPTPEERARAIENARRTNFGFERVERLAGNIGYLDLRGFSGLPEASETGVAAMNFLNNTDALIIDLRKNGGGSPVMIGLISSYLLEGVVHLNDFYRREGDRMEQFFTTAEVKGRRYGSAKPVFVLTSGRTFSAAEEFTYNLKNLQRATIVGETTGGGAHPGGPRRINEHFTIWVPTGRAINPITKTNWEGTGVEPDLKTEAALALKTAHLAALEKLLASTPPGRDRDFLERTGADVAKKDAPE